MHIHVETQALTVEDWWDPSAPVRGTEEFYVETACHLASFGHRVTLAYDGPSTTLGTAAFVPRGVVEEADVLLDCNIRVPHHRRAFKAARHVAWTNFVDADASQYSSYDALVCVSRTHQEMLKGGIVVPHGIDRNRYKPLTKKRMAIYTSSMDRGGELLHAHKNHIEAETGASVVFSRYPTTGIYTCAARSRPLSEDEMSILYGEATWWIHPAFGVELFCLAAAKAQAAGCIPIVRPSMALDETVRCGYKIRTDKEDAFICAVIDAMNGTSLDPNTIYLGMSSSASAHIPSWREATAQLAEILVVSSSRKRIPDEDRVEL